MKHNVEFGGTGGYTLTPGMKKAGADVLYEHLANEETLPSAEERQEIVAAVYLAMCEAKAKRKLPEEEGGEGLA